MNPKLFVGNWKMNPQSSEEARDLVISADDFFKIAGYNPKLTFVFCPPFVFAQGVHGEVKESSSGQEFLLGSQDIAIENSGAWTGEVSGPMLRNVGASYVIIGHSERRWKLGESDEVANLKLKAALQNNLTPIVCIGERARDEHYKYFIRDQLDKTFKDISSEQFKNVIIAYEPVWAISSHPDAQPDNPESAVESIRLIKEIVTTLLSADISATKFLYGGSVNASNIEGFISQEEVDGVLVGGASVKKEEFLSILPVINGLLK